jgi:hypothetical protein
LSDTQKSAVSLKILPDELRQLIRSVTGSHMDPWRLEQLRVGAAEAGEASRMLRNMSKAR